MAGGTENNSTHIAMTESTTVCCFQWNNGFRNYKPAYVNVLAKSIARNLSIPHRFVCITDETAGFSRRVELLKTPDAALVAGSIPSPEGARFPASYRRLWALSEEAKVLGDRVMMIDIDCVVPRNIDSLFDEEADFVGWRPNYAWGNEHRIGGGSWMVRTGSCTGAWNDFIADPPAAIARARKAGFRGSDQAWLSYYMKNCAVWPRNSGILQSQDLRKNRFTVLPAGARIVHFNGRHKPWDMLRIPWIRKHWR